MSAKAAFVLGLFVLAAAVTHGGFYAAGHDFVVNRFTGESRFVPAEEEYEDGQVPARATGCACPSLTSRGPGARVARFERR
jgi:hypothetical protein